MSFSQVTINGLLEKIEQNQICLPSIQRAFVWNEEKIEHFFDSIYRGYPFGGFMFWRLSEESFENYSYYKLLEEYSELSSPVGAIIKLRDSEGNAIPDVTIPLYAVIDGQQRLTSINIAFNGSYKIQRNGNVVEKQLYFNLLAFLKLRDENLEEILNEEHDEEEKKELTNPIFKMFTESESRARNNSAENKFRNEIWFQVKHFKESIWDVFLPNAEDTFGLGELERENNIKTKLLDIIAGYRTPKQITDEWLFNISNNSTNYNSFKGHIATFVLRIKKMESISYFELKHSNKLIDITEAFVRINQGIPLSKLDLLFSTLIANWEEGKLFINGLIKNLKDLGFKNLDLEFILRTCLYLSGGNVLFNLRSFKNATITTIQQNFKIDGAEIMDYETAILEVVQFLKDCSITSGILTSKNVLIPLIYHVYKGGDLTSIQSRKEAINYIFVSYLQRVFGSHGDSLLSNLRRVATLPDGQLVNQEFNYLALVGEIQEDNKRKLYFDIDEETIENWLDERNTQKDVAHLLHLTRNWDNFNENLSVQILHPKQTLSSELVDILGGVSSANKICAKAWNWALIPTESPKNSTFTLSAFYDPLTLAQKNSFKEQAIIPIGISLETEQFVNFLEVRKQELRNILIDRLL
jgi:uncharacterized protein with ParB-like and HNH nuclease domain